MRSRGVPARVVTPHATDRHPCLARADPSERAARCRPSSRGGRLRGGDVIGPLLAVERAARGVGLRLVVSRRGVAGDVAAVRRGECSGQRYHPAIVAQAASSLCEMFPGRLWLALGSGEASNEHITGERWPVKTIRNARLRECVDVMRALFAGETVDHDGLVRVDRARLWTLPPEPPLIVGPAISVQTAAWVGEWADGLVTVNQPRDKLERMIAAFREHGGEGKRLALQVHLRGPPTSSRRSRSPTISGARTSSRHRSAGTSRRSSSSTWPRSTCAPRTSARQSSSRPTSLVTRPGFTIWSHSASTRSTCTTSARACARSSTPSRSTCTGAAWELTCGSNPRATCGGRTRSSTPGRRGLPRRRRDGIGDQGPHPPGRLPRRPRGHLSVADAVLPISKQGRRLRHHRLLWGGLAPGQPRRLRRIRAHGQRSRHQGNRRPGHEPHLRRASLVRGGARRPRIAVPLLLRLAGRALGRTCGHLVPR